MSHLIKQPVSFVKSNISQGIYRSHFFDYVGYGLSKVVHIADASFNSFDSKAFAKAIAEVAEKEGFKVIAGVFRLISKVEIEHEKRYLKLLENVETDHVFKKDGTNRWKCILCGYVHEGPEAPAKCPVCLNPKAFFEIKETNY